MKYLRLKKRGMMPCIILLAIFMSLFAQSENENRIFQTNLHYEEGDWISYSEHRFINTIAIGNEFVYFATNGGIIRYNYFSNKWDFPWTRSNGLASNTIIVVAFDENTNFLWCSTPLGVSYYQPGQKIWANTYKDEIGIRTFDDVRSIGFDTKTVWLITMNGQIFRGDNQMGMFAQVFEEPGNSGNIKWFGQRGWQRIQLTPLFMPDGYLFDTRGYIQDIELRTFDVSYYVLDRWGFMWFGTDGLGATRADIRTDRMELMPYGLMQQNVTAIAKKEDQFWIGGWDEMYHDHNYGEESGITRWDIRHNEWTHYQAKYITDFDNDQVTSIAVDGDTIWFGTEQGLVRFIPDENEWRTFDQSNRLRSNYIFDVVVNDQYVWVATPSGIDRIYKYGIKKDSLNITWIARDDLRELDVYDLEFMDDILWAGTEFGAYYYDTLKDSGGFFEKGVLGPGTKRVYAVSWGGDEVWFGTSDGVEVYDLNEEKWCPTPKRRINMTHRINFIRVNDQVAWVGTDQGAWKYDLERNYWKLFTIEDGLVHNTVQAILIDGDYVWFSTPQGLTKFYWNNPFRID